AFMMLNVMISMAGVPPTAGFYAKLAVLRAVVDVHQSWLAIVAVLFSLIGAFYYLRVVKLMYFDAAEENAQPLGSGLEMRLVLSANGLLLLALGIYPSVLLALCGVTIG
ncbi:MAG: proton-conducting transporter transmembrane domain-containing protein, partial [Gammaproteobacteria bacterium]